jgi:hypothetical protein
MAEWRNGGNGSQMAEWSNGGNGYLPTIFMVHAAADDKDDNTDTFKSFIVLTCAMHMHTPFTTSITIYILSISRVDRGLRNSKCAPMQQCKSFKVVFLCRYKIKLCTGLK